jgi:endonuclease-3
LKHHLNEIKRVPSMTSNNIKRANEILWILEHNFEAPEPWSVASDPFKVLVRTIISQSTTEVNTQRAYLNLSRKTSINPASLAETEVTEIEDALRVAGLYRNKSRVLKKTAELVLEKFNGSLSFIYTSPMEEARTKLMSLPGVGPKTADIVLLFSAGKPTLPVDTHIYRVSKRLKLVPQNGDYETVRETLQRLYPSKEYFDVHTLFITLGRKYCKAQKPLHSVCPVRDLCPSAET